MTDRDFPTSGAEAVEAADSEVEVEREVGGVNDVEEGVEAAVVERNMEFD